MHDYSSNLLSKPTFLFTEQPRKASQACEHVKFVGRLGCESYARYVTHEAVGEVQTLRRLPALHLQAWVPIASGRCSRPWPCAPRLPPPPPPRPPTAGGAATVPSSLPLSEQVSQSGRDVGGGGGGAPGTAVLCIIMLSSVHFSCIGEHTLQPRR